MLSRSSTRAIFPTISWADPDERGTSEAQQRWQRIFDWRERALIAAGTEHFKPGSRNWGIPAGWDWISSLKKALQIGG